MDVLFSRPANEGREASHFQLSFAGKQAGKATSWTPCGLRHGPFHFCSLTRFGATWRLCAAFDFATP